MTKVLITGANGFVGSHLVERLLKDDCVVTCLLRPKSDQRWLEGRPVTMMRADLNDADALASVVRNQDVIFHVAAQTAADSDEEYYTSNVQGSVNLLKAVIRYNPGIQHFIFISSIAVAGPSRIYRPHTEEDEAHPISAYGQSKLSAEEAVMASRGQLPVTIVRAPVVFGPRDREVLRLIRLVKKRIYPVIGLAKRSYSMIYVKDLVDGLAQIAGQKKTRGQLYYMASPNPVSWHALIRQIGRCLNRKPCMIYAPIWVFSLFVYFHDAWAKRRGVSSLFHIQRIHELQAARWECQSHKIRDDIQFVPSSDFSKALQETIEWYDDEGWL